MGFVLLEFTLLVGSVASVLRGFVLVHPKFLVGFVLVHPKFLVGFVLLELTPSS